MPTFSSLDLKNYNGEVVEGSVTLQHGFGVLLGVNVSPHVGFQAELDYNQVSQKYKDVNLDRVVKIRYLNIPLLLSLNTNKAAPINLNFVVGPQFGINVGSNMTASGNGNTTTLQAVVAVKKGDVGLAYGAGLEFALNQDHTCRLDLGYRGFYGLVDMNASSVGSDSYNVVVKASRKSNGAYVGLTFLF
jgi:opacity protein-like surface antigen